jgi:hypothetical protein
VKINGELEIDSERGVIYFHPHEGPMVGASQLRIGGLPKDIPTNRQLDIIVGQDSFTAVCNWQEGRLSAK